MSHFTTWNHETGPTNQPSDRPTNHVNELDSGEAGNNLVNATIWNIYHRLDLRLAEFSSVKFICKSARVFLRPRDPRTS